MPFSGEVERCAEAIKQGGVVVYPTDTIWGIGCDATNDEAVAKLMKIKNRESEKGLIVLLENENDLMRYVRYIPEVAWDIIDNSEKPITIVYPEGYRLSEKVLAEDGSVGIRITKDEFCRQLIRKIRRPLVSTSANIAGEPSPRVFDDISEEMINQVDYAVDYRRDEVPSSSASSVIKLGVTGQVEILRP